MGKLEGKVAVITAATSGMALATAELFVEEGAYVTRTRQLPASERDRRGVLVRVADRGTGRDLGTGRDALAVHHVDGVGLRTGRCGSPGAGRGAQVLAGGRPQGDAFHRRRHLTLQPSGCGTLSIDRPAKVRHYPRDTQGERNHGWTAKSGRSDDRHSGRRRPIGPVCFGCSALQGRRASRIFRR